MGAVLAFSAKKLTSDSRAYSKMIISNDMPPELVLCFIFLFSHRHSSTMLEIMHNLLKLDNSEALTFGKLQRQSKNLRATQLCTCAVVCWDPIRSDRRQAIGAVC